MPPSPNPTRQQLELLEAWYSQWLGEIDDARREGRLAPTSASTYSLHSGNFVRWIEGKFKPGSRGR